MKKVGIIGSGEVARSLGDGFLKYGYQVMLSSRDTSKIADWKEKGGTHAHAGSFTDAAIFGDIIVLAVRGSAATDAIEEAGPQNMANKTIIDTTNPSADEPPENGVLKLFTTLNDSLMEQLQARFPELHFVKSFNIVGAPFMVDPSFKDGQPTMFICGNNDSAKSTVNAILVQFGWEVVDMGKATAARAIEPLCVLWCIPGFLRDEWGHAFKLLKA